METRVGKNKFGRINITVYYDRQKDNFDEVSEMEIKRLGLNEKDINCILCLPSNKEKNNGKPAFRTGPGK